MKINQFESKITQEFKERNNLIPSVYEITKHYLNKHDAIFIEILKLKKKDFAENTIFTKLAEKSNTYKLIHNELNFIFKLCNKHPKINKNGKFLFIKDLIIEKSMSLGIKLELYKKIIKQYNYMIMLKNLTIIGLIIPLTKKETI